MAAVAGPSPRADAAPMELAVPDHGLAEAGGPEAMQTDGNGDAPQGPREFTPLKVSLYELLIRQLQDDGLVNEAHSLSQQLHIQPNHRVEKDALLDLYGKSMKFAFGDGQHEEWVPLRCTPVPPLGAEERCLDFEGRDAKAAGAGDQPGQQPRKNPEIRLLYTSQHKFPCRSVVFSPDGRQCATGCTDGSIRILDCARMRSCAASTDGPLGRMRITEEELMKPVTRTLQDHVASVTCLAFHPMNPTLFSGSLDKAVKIFDLTRPPGHKKAFSVLQDVHPVRCICIHPCGDFLLVGTAHQAVRLYDLQTLNCFTTFQQESHHGGGINDLRCSSDGRMFASASVDGTIQLWDSVSHRVVNRLPKAHSGTSVTSLRLSRNLRYLLSSGTDGRHRLWDLREGQEVFNMGFGPRSCDFSTAVFAAGERYVAAANSCIQTSDMSLFDAQTGSPVFMKLGMHQLPVHALDSSPIDRTIFSGCDDDKARYFSIDDRTA